MLLDVWRASVDPHLLRSSLLRPLALVVDSAEVGDDDGHRQGDDQHAAQRADGAEDLPHDGFWNHVSISKEEERGSKVRPKPPAGAVQTGLSGDLSVITVLDRTHTVREDACSINNCNLYSGSAR